MTMTPKATTWWPPDSAGLSTAGVDAASRTVAMLLVPPEKPRGPEHEDHGHDHEDDRIGGFRVEDLGQSLDHPEGEARDDGAHDGPQSADHDDREDDDDQVGTHERVDLVDGRRQHACDPREGDAEAVRERHPARDVD